MSRVWRILFLGGWLVWSGGADGLGAVIRIDLGAIDHVVSAALNESRVLQKMADKAVIKKPSTKAIKDIAGLKVKELCPPSVSLVLSPGSGLLMAVLVQMTIAGKSNFIGGSMEITLPMKLRASGRLRQGPVGIPSFSSSNCSIALVSVKSNLPSSVLPRAMNKCLENTLHRALPGLASFNLEISNNMVLGLPPLVTTTLRALIPKPVVIEMREAKTPMVTITLEKSFVQLFSNAEFRVSPLDSAPKSLFVLDVHSDLEAQFAIAEEKLQLSLSLQRLSQVALASSSLGIFDELPLKGVLADIIHVAYVPWINRLLRGGIPLPHLLSITYQWASISWFQDALVLDVPVTES